MRASGASRCRCSRRARPSAARRRWWVMRRAASDASLRGKAAGFTLVELLVAIAIFGVLSGIAYRSLAVVLDSRGRIEQENRKWRGLAMLFARLEQDVAAGAPRPIRGTG